MPNKLTRVFDNIGFSFVIENNSFKILQPLSSYKTLNNEHIGYNIPYIARNSKLGLVETGVGEVSIDNYGKIIVKRIQIAISSNNNEPVNFPNDNNEFYLFANQTTFDKTINNIVVIDSNKNIEPVSALYLVDCGKSDLTVFLPEYSDNLMLEFKVIDPTYSLTIRSKDQSVIAILSSSNTYTKLISNDNGWVELTKNNSNQLSSLSLPSDNTFNMMANPQGSDYSLQYKSGTDLQGSRIFWDPINSGVLFGSDSYLSAKNFIPTTGNQSTLFNYDGNGGDFIVYGSGINKNLFFAYDGRVGINIPSGSRPSTILHIVNTVCQEGLRLENRTPCYPANITLYHKPATSLTNNSVVSQINLAGKNAAGNQTNYAKIESRIISTTTNSEKGALDIIVVSGSTGIKTINTNTDNTIIGYDSGKVTINNNGNIAITNGATQLSITQQGEVAVSNAVLSATGINVSNLTAANVNAASLKLPNVAPSSLLTINSAGNIVSSAFGINSAGSITMPSVKNKLLSTTNDGSITGVYTLDDYFLTEQDIVWSKYQPRNASVCLRQITFTNPVSSEEFAVGDQIVVVSSGINFYRTISSLDLSNNNIAGLLVDQNITQNATTDITVVSVTKGGYLTISKNVDSGITSDATSNTISIRPLTDTVFNTKQKDINFIVYGIDDTPALSVRANAGRILTPSGVYHGFATKRNDMFSTIVNSGGVGLSNLYSSANFNYDNTRNIFFGLLSSVGTNGLPSYYGTYDQNGNASEWVEKPYSIESSDTNEFVAGGSYLTPSDNAIGFSGLKSIQNLPRGTGYGDVGFRIASLQGISDSVYVSSSEGLNLSFVAINDPKNAEDKTTTYLYDSNSYSPIVINNLGVVNNIYRIGKYEVTNSQYCKFLNIVAKNNDRGLYDTKMASDNRGGINRINSGGIYEYSVKPNMSDKPVVFVSYLSIVKFINWLHNGSLQNINESDIDYNLNTGAYLIYSTGANSYNIVKQSYRKYWLPDLNEWHKAAYYEPVASSDYAGTSTVNIKRDSSQIIATGLNSAGQADQLYANLSVSGWLYVDHIVVGDGTIRSAKKFTGLTDPSDPIPTTSQGTTTTAPAINLTTQYNNPYASIFGAVASCITAGCSFDGKPLRIDDDTISLCTDNTLSYNEVPWWCNTNNNGPGWFN